MFIEKNMKKTVIFLRFFVNYFSKVTNVRFLSHFLGLL